MRKIFIRITKICTVIFGLLFIVLTVGEKIMLENATLMNNAFHQPSQYIVEKESETEVDTEYYKSSFNSVAEVINNSETVARKIVEEGATLLKNNNNALPIPKNSKISLFSVSCLSMAYGGGGSSESRATPVPLDSALANVGLSINQDLWNWYSANKDTYMRTKAGGIGIKYTIKDAPWDDIPQDVKSQSARSAVFILTRLGTENEDLTVNTGDPTDMTNGSYLMLSPNEKTVLRGLKQLKEDGVFSNIVVVLNSPNQVETNFVNDPQYGIDSLLWVGSFGTIGPKALANLLVGDVTPSGRLSDIYWQEHRFNPTMTNFVKMNADGTGQNAYFYEGLSSSGEPLDQVRYYGGGVQGCPYVVYQEGIYNGYRYAETRYEDYVTARSNVGNFIYADTITYPFGYGLSFTTFEYSDYEVNYNAEKDQFRVSVRVTNTGNVAGKEVVQVYLQKPFTEYDIENHIEKSAVDLVGFAKTKILNKNESQVVTIDVDKEYFASYDSYGEKTYVLDAGDYFLTVAKDSHDAVNNILYYKHQNSIGTVDLTRMSSMPNNSGDGAERFVYRHNEANFDAETYSMTDDPVKSGYKSTPTKITNQFDTADLNIYENAGDDNKVTYITRTDWEGTVKFGLDADNNYLDNYVHLTWNEGMEHDHFEVDFNDAEVLKDDEPYPTMNSTATAYSLIDMMKREDGTPIPYDNEMWDALLDQLSWDDMVKLLSAAFRHTEAVGSISKPHTIDHNGAVGVNQAYSVGANGLATRRNDPDKNKVPPAYPCNGIVAATYNVELVKEYGQAWGEDGLWAGYAGLFGPGINGHRAPYSGRIFEYYSEDPILAGKICAPLCIGMKEKGIYVYLKHACLNEQETRRTTLATWANEQTIRENYLRAFEIAIEEGNAECVMLGLNKIGPFETALTNLCNGVLRNEFGMRGHVITDFITDAKRLMMPYAHLMGTDLPDRDFNMYGYYEPYKTGHGKIAWGMREACHHVLYTVVHSAAMNGMSSNTVVYSVTPAWQIQLATGVNLCLLFFLISLFMLISFYVFPLVPDTLSGLSRGKGKKKDELVSMKDVGHSKFYKRKDKWYAYAFRGAIGAVGLIVFIAQLAGMGGRLKETEDIIKLATATDDGYINETSGGADVKSNYFEAETAVFDGVSCYGDAQSPREKNTAISYVYGSIHGGIGLTNIYTPTDAETPNTLTFSFSSNKKVRCKMRITLSTFRASNGIIQTHPLSSFYQVDVNGNEVVNTMEVSKDKVIETLKIGNYTFPMTFVDLTIKLEEGENTIVFTPQSSIQYCGAVLFDSIDIRTSANLTGYEDNYWDMTGAAIQNQPTYTSQGIITYNGTNAQALPSLQYGVEHEVYSFEETEEFRKYYLGNTDLLVYSIFKNEHTLTIKSPYACFADETREMTLKATEGLPAGMFHVSPPGMAFKGWTNYNKPNEIFKEEEFMMLDEDMDIAPYFETVDMVSKLAPDIPDDDFKKINTNLNGDYNINTSTAAATYGFDNKTLLSNLTNSVVLDPDDIPQVATLYNYENVPNAGSKFAIHHAIPLRRTNTIKYVVQNQGLETLNLDFARTKSSGNAFAESNPQKHFVLEPGERISFTLTQPGSHDTLITGVRVNNQTASAFKLAVLQYISYGDHEEGEEGDVFVRLKGNVTFVDGTTYKLLAEGSSLPEVILTGEDVGKDDTFLAWRDAFGNVYQRSTFKMSSEDITLTPVFTRETVREGYGKLLFGSGNTGGSYTAEGGYIGAYSSSAYKVGNTFIGDEYALTMRFITASTPGTDPTGTNSNLRVLTGYTCSTGTTNYNYTLRNDGNKTISFWLYHRTGSGDTSAVDYKEIVIAPGEIQSVTITRSYTQNNNVITHFKFLDDNYIGQDLSLYVFATGDGTKTQVTLKNAQFADSTTSKLLNVGAELPALATEGVVGVKDENDNCYTLSEYKVPANVASATTLTALFEQETVEAGTGKVSLVSGNVSLDQYGVAIGHGGYTYIGEDYAHVTRLVAQGSGTDNTGTNASYRYRIVYNTGGESTRVTSTLVWKFKNMGTTTLTFDVYQRGAGNDTSAPDYHRVVLAPGESTTVTINWGKRISSNLLTYIKFADENWVGQKLAASVYTTVI